MEKSQITPYSIYIENRPMRVAFLIDPKDKNVFKRIESIIIYNQDRWGGRFNPIVPTKGNSITKEWWQFLKEYDPDVIKSFVSIEKRLLKKINDLLTPHLIEDFQPKRKDPVHLVYLDDQGLSVLPTKQNIMKVTGFSLERTYLVLFEVDKHKKSEINKFLKINFGTYDPMLITSQIVKQFPNRKEFVVKNKSQLANALLSLNSFDYFVYPSQLCCFPSHSVSTNHNYPEQVFNIVVGDSVNDLLYHWNRILSINDFNQQKLNGIWMSRKMANDSKMIKALNVWIKRAVDPGGSGDKDVRFVSFSLKKKELQKIANKIMDKVYFRRSVETFRKTNIPNISRNSYLPPIKERLHPIRVTGDEAHFSVPPPDILEGPSGGQCWMTDVFIEFRPERFPYIINKDYWWRLPKHNDLALSMFRKPARVMGNGIPSVLLQRDGFDRFPKNKVKIQLLDDASVFRTLFVGEKTPAYTTDPRTALAYRPYNYITRSDKGKYLSGVLDLFGYLYYASTTLENRYWRRMFQLLSHQNPDTETSRRDALFNKLKKNITKKDLASNGGIEWLTDLVLKLAKQEGVLGKELPYEDFENNLKSEIDEFNKNQDASHKHTLDRENLLREIESLIDSDVLLQGIKPKCPLCGTSNWYPLEELRKQISCKGCGFKHTLGPEQKWYYRLNSLVQSASIQHGLVPVILVLGNLLDDARDCFIYYPPIELYKKNTRPDELDIVCVQDGKLVIGEVKTSNSLYREKHFEKMKKIAEKVHPDRIIFSSLEKDPTSLIKKYIMQLQKQLAQLDIKVEWYSLPDWTFDARPL